MTRWSMVGCLAALGAATVLAGPIYDPGNVRVKA